MSPRLTSRNAAIVGAAVILLLIVVGWFVLVSPQRSKASKLGSQISDAQTQLTLALAEARTLRREQHSRASELAALTRALPRGIEMSSILRQLSAVAAATGVRVDSITPSAAQAGAGYKTVPLNVTLEGRYFGLVSFLHVLRARADLQGKKPQASGRLFRVDGMQLTGGAGAPLSATMTIDTFTSGPAAADTAASSTSSGPTSESGGVSTTAPATGP
jgi:hypothetical protein